MNVDTFTPRMTPGLKAGKSQERSRRLNDDRFYFKRYDPYPYRCFAFPGCIILFYPPGDLLIRPGKSRGRPIIIKCPKCGGPLYWLKKKTEWGCKKCKLILARFWAEFQKIHCELCGKDIGGAGGFKDCDCWAEIF